MKVIKFVTTFLLLFILGIFACYGNVKYNSWTGNFIEAFEQTDADFKFYNIKINSIASNEKSEEDIKNMFIDVVKCFHIDESKIKWNIKKEENTMKIYTNIKDNSYSISFAAIKKNNKEYYIIIDILNNKLYKNIVDIYKNLYNLINKYSYDVEISTCIVGEYTKNLQLNKCNDILENILYNMNAKKIDRMEDYNYISISAYSNLLVENNLEYLDNKINFNIGIRYSENGEKTLLYMATPIIKLDY